MSSNPAIDISNWDNEFTHFMGTHTQQVAALKRLLAGAIYEAVSLDDSTKVRQLVAMLHNHAPRFVVPVFRFLVEDHPDGVGNGPGMPFRALSTKEVERKAVKVNLPDGTEVTLPASLSFKYNKERMDSTGCSPEILYGIIVGCPDILMFKPKRVKPAITQESIDAKATRLAKEIDALMKTAEDNNLVKPDALVSEPASTDMDIADIIAMLGNFANSENVTDAETAAIKAFFNVLNGMDLKDAA